MAKDIYHNTARTALEKDGWKITDDPLTLTELQSRAVFSNLTECVLRLFFRGTTPINDRTQ